MLLKAKNWFIGLSKIGKTGVILTSLFVVGAAASPGQVESPKSAVTTPPVVQSDQQTMADRVEKKTITKTEEISFEKTTVQDANLEAGKTIVRTAGVKGVKTLVYEVVYKNGVETDKKLTSEQVTTPPISEVTAIGTRVSAAALRPSPTPTPSPTPQPSNCDPNYTPCVPNVGYDLDCPDIGFQVTVVGIDRHGFDGNDNDGLGCESY